MHDDQKGFLEEIQSLSEGTKKRVLIIATVLIMIIIVGAWAVYFNGVIGATSPSGDTSAAAAPVAPAPVPIAITAAPPAITPSASGPGLWQNIRDGFSSFFGFFAGIFSHPSNYSIQPK